MLDDPALEETAPEDEEYRPLPIREWLTPAQWAGTFAVGAALAVASFVRYGAGTHAIVGAIFCPALTLLSAIDIRHWLLPNIIIGPAAGAIVLTFAVGEPHRLPAHLIAGVAIFSLLFVLSLATQAKQGMGMGDAKLTFLIGVALGLVRTIAAIVVTLGPLLALMLSLGVRRQYRLRVRRLPTKTVLETPFPYGPLLALGALIAYFTG